METTQSDDTKPPVQPVTFTMAGIVRVLAVLVAAAVLWRLRDMALLIVIAFIIASAMLPLSLRLEKRHIPRVWTVLVLDVLILGLLAVLLVLLAPVIADQLQQLAVNAPAQMNRVAAWATGKVSALAGHHIAPPDVSAQAGKYLQEAATAVLKWAAGAAGGIASFILMVVLAAFMVIDDRRFRAGFLRFVPESARQAAGEQWDEVQARMGGYVAGMALISVEKGIIITIGLWVIGVPYAILLGVLAGLLNFIPYAGFWSVFLLTELLAFNADPVKALWVFALFMGHEWIKSGLLGPYLVGRATKVHPAIVLIAIAAGAKLFGVLGTLVAAPLAAAVSVVVENLLPAPPEESVPESADAKERPEQAKPFRDHRGAPASQ